MLEKKTEVIFLLCYTGDSFPTPEQVWQFPLTWRQIEEVSAWKEEGVLQMCYTDSRRGH